MTVKIIISFIKKLLRVKKPQPKAPLRLDPKAIIAREHHTLSKAHISPNALKVLNQLHSRGFEAYVVGGGVRDLLLNHQPKDFDVATNAHPNEVRKLFRNARVIGRRFKIVHVWFHRETIEVSTFRAGQQDSHDHQTNDKGMIIRDNVYGSLEEDAWRRDFTINALYYHIADSSIVDITGGFQDLKSRTLRMIGEPSVRYEEDPVRMLRVVRFASKLDFNICEHTRAPIEKCHALIANISPSRLFDEIVKVYQCGQAKKAHALMQEFKLFPMLFPSVHQQLDSAYPAQALINLALESTDARIKVNKPVNPAFIYAIFLWFPLQAKAKALQESENIPPLPAIEQAMSQVLSEQSRTVSIPKRFTQMMREIWILQYRFHKRLGGRAQHLTTHPRFRAAYDMLVLRSQVQDASADLAQWWTSFQEVDEAGQREMVEALAKRAKKKRRSRPS